MTEPTQNSPSEEKPKTRLDKLKEDLKTKDVSWDDMAVLMFGANEQIIGEIIAIPDAKGIDFDYRLVNLSREIKNPKRFARLQRVTPKGITVDFIVGDLDLVESGVMQVFAVGGYWISELGEESQGALLSLYYDFLKNKEAARVASSGLIIPDMRVKT